MPDGDAASIRALRDRGGKPTDLPDPLLLGEVAGYDRFVARDRVLAFAEQQVAVLGSSPAPEDEAWGVWNRWVVELLTDDELADWFLAGLPIEFVEAQLIAAARDHDIVERPLDARIVLVEGPFLCPVSGEVDETLALALIRRDDPDAEPVLLALRTILQIVMDGIDHPAGTLPGPIRPRPTGRHRRCRPSGP